MLFISVNFSTSLAFFFISFWKSFSSFWRVSSPASEKDLRYSKKALNLTSYDFSLKTSYFMLSICTRNRNNVLNSRPPEIANTQYPNLLSLAQLSQNRRICRECVNSGVVGWKAGLWEIGDLATVLAVFGVTLANILPYNHVCLTKTVCPSSWHSVCGMIIEIQNPK